MSSEHDPLKQIIAIRGDLSMPAGKLGAQTAHATQYIFQMLLEVNPLTGGVLLIQNQEYWDWLTSPTHTKICLRVPSLDALLGLHFRAKEAGLLCALVEDAGLTVFDRKTVTCCAIGPARASVLRPLTKDLALY